MEIHEGRHYRTRAGDVFGPMVLIHDRVSNVLFFKDAGKVEQLGLYWHLDGLYDAAGGHPNDLVEEFNMPSPDPINAPEHYISHASGIQPIDIAEHMTFCLGNVVKYVMRFEKKGGLEDLRKAEFYIKREIARREKQS